MNSNLKPEKRANKHGVLVTKHVLATPPVAADRKPIPAPAPVPAAPKKPASFTFAAEDMKELGEMISTSTDEERSYYYLFLEKGDIDGIRILHAYKHEPSTTYDIMNVLEDLDLSSPSDSIEQRQAKVDLHAPFYEAGLIDYAAYGADDDRNEELIKVVDEYASVSTRVLDLMTTRDLSLAEELRSVLREMDGVTPSLREGVV